MKIFSILFFSQLLVINTLLSQRFAIIGDSRGATAYTDSVAALVKSYNPEFVAAAGDNFLYSQGTIDQQIGQFYHEYIFPYYGAFGQGATTNRFFPALGNHDIEGTGLSDHLAYFTLPGNERYYDFVWGNVHFFILNSNTSESDGTADTSVQALWLQASLATSVSPFKIVVLHHSPFSSGSHGSSSYTQWPYRQWGANIVFSGHDHYYERMFIDSLHYVVNGAGGSSLYAYYNPLPGSLLAYYENYGAVIADANADSLVFSYYNINDSIIDKFTIYPNQTSTGKPEKLPVGFNPVLNPNPFTHSTVLMFSVQEDCTVSVKALSLTGEHLQTLYSGKARKGLNKILINSGTLNRGTFIFSITAGETTKTVKAFKKDAKN